MAYRRRQGTQGMGRSSSFAFKEETEDRYYSNSSATSNSSSTLAAQAIRASAAHRDSSHSSGYAHSASHKGAPTYDYTAMGSSNEAGSFWGVLARKAKAILDDDNNNNVPYQSEYINPNTINTRPQFLHSSTDDNNNNNIDQVEFSKKVDNPTLRKGIDAFTTQMNRIGDTIGNALEEGRTIVENKTADLIQETRKLQIRRKGDEQQHLVSAAGYHGPMQQSAQLQNLTSQEDQIKASRDVAMATAAKAKLLLRELKTVKADLAFEKQRCSQLEEENKILRDARDKGVNPPEDDDMIRVQLETLLAEKARLAHENSVYARENRFLREIVEYHQLTMQDVVYLDEGIEEVTEVYPIPAVSRRLSDVSTTGGGSSPTSPASLSRTTSNASRTSSVSNTTLSSLMTTTQLQLPPMRSQSQL